MSDFATLSTSPEGKARVMKGYQAILDRWPVPYTAWYFTALAQPDIVNKRLNAVCDFIKSHLGTA